MRLILSVYPKPPAYTAPGSIEFHENRQINLQKRPLTEDTDNSPSEADTQNWNSKSRRLYSTKISHSFQAICDQQPACLSALTRHTLKE